MYWKNQTFHRFVNILDAYNLKYKVEFPTRITAESQTDIDNFISNKPGKNLKYLTGLITHISGRDHDGQLLEMLDMDRYS